MHAIGEPLLGRPKTSNRERSFAGVLSGHDNALNFVRLGLALVVIVGHTPPVAGASTWPGWLVEPSEWAVDGFFIISGYLIAGSRLRSSWWSYSVRRFARIYPGFWGAILVTALLFAPIAAAVSTSTWSWRAAGDYIVGNLKIINVQYTMEGMTFPHYSAWNGSSWTLRYELLAYLGCLVVFSIRFFRRHLMPTAAVMWLITTGFYVVGRPLLHVTTNDYMNMGRLGSFFCVGIFAYAFRDKLTVRWRWVALSGAAVVVLFVVGEKGEMWAHLPLAYLVLSLGVLLPTRIGSRNDISYGVYIYAFPVQQTMSFLGVDRFGGVIHMLASAIVTVIFALASWYLIEKRAMGAARRLIRRVRRGRGEVPGPGAHFAVGT